jgi:DNA processing protein
MTEEKVYQIALSMVPGIGDVNARKLVSYCGSASEIFQKNRNKLSGIPGIGTYTARAILNFKDFDRAEEEVKACEIADIDILFYTDKDYPYKLKQAPDSPVILYYKGEHVLNTDKIVSIVGTRNATAYGKEFVEELVKGLQGHQALIVSGLAYGIDIHAHKMALASGLSTIGVMASGLDIVYPYAHKGIATEMTKSGGLLSETPLGIKPEAHFFPARNRIIAGLADAVVVVEAAERGGALITAEIANSYSRDVFALPGNLSRPFSKGCNNLIKQNKAHLITGIADMEYIMNWQEGTGSNKPEQKVLDFSSLDDNEQNIMKVLMENEAGLLIDDLSWRSQVPLNRLAASLLNLEFKGFVKPMPGKKYKAL